MTIFSYMASTVNSTG